MSRVLVPRIKDVTIDIVKTYPPILVVTAIGEVNSGGYTNPQLEKREYTTVPADGIWEYELTVEEPTGQGSTTALEDTKPKDHKWEGYPEADVKGVKIYGSEEPKIVMLSSK